MQEEGGMMKAMIGHITGTVRALHSDHALIDVGGIGYIVFATPETLAVLAETKMVSFHTHLIVRENALDLYGFAEKKELSLFEKLLSVSGIGPKSALNILSTVGFQDLHRATAEGNSSYLTKVSGIGKKTAERIVVELKDKMAKEDLDSGTLHHTEDALEALVAMGYSLREARDALKNTPEEARDSNARLREALKVLSQ